MKSSLVQHKYWTLAPLFGSIAFLLLYVLATVYYPGGSQADAHARGFTWLHNYWCNLLDAKAVNGQANASRPLGFAAMAVMALTLLSFWVIAAYGLSGSKRSRNIIIGSGLASLCLLPFLPTGFHDSAINVSASLGLVAMAFIYAGIYKEGWTLLFLFGLFNLFLIALNNYIYYRTSLYYLPVVQKFTFLSFLLWVCGVTVKLYQRPQSKT